MILPVFPPAKIERSAIWKFRLFIDQTFDWTLASADKVNVETGQAAFWGIKKGEAKKYSLWNTVSTRNLYMLDLEFFTEAIFY